MWFAQRQQVSWALRKENIQNVNVPARAKTFLDTLNQKEFHTKN